MKSPRPFYVSIASAIIGYLLGVTSQANIYNALAYILMAVFTILLSVMARRLWPALLSLAVFSLAVSLGIGRQIGGIPEVLFILAPLCFVINVPVALLTCYVLYRRRPHPIHCCQKCGYDLRGGPHEQCPECGEPVKLQPSIE